MAVLEVNDDGILQVPAQFLADARPHARYNLDMSGDVVTLRPAKEERPFWETATIEERIEAFRRWSTSAPANTPNVPTAKMRREEWYD